MRIFYLWTRDRDGSPTFRGAFDSRVAAIRHYNEWYRKICAITEAWTVECVLSHDTHRFEPLPYDNGLEYVR